ncbi:GxxExxY protein [Salinisphaera aquimarina]|uniref:GxxExxY protein n=1 Tax=Salinisphaera aquimarina TaxID=2094031 RepID=A0ABV7EM27_9GAMM
MDERDPESYRIIGAAIEVHQTLGTGFLELVYQQALAFEFGERDIPFVRERGLEIEYKGQLLDCRYRADFICFESVIVEIKAINHLTTRDDAQVLKLSQSNAFQSRAHTQLRTDTAPASPSRTLT